MHELLKSVEIGNELETQASQGLDVLWCRAVAKEQPCLGSDPPQIHCRGAQKIGRGNHCQTNGIHPLWFD